MEEHKVGDWVKLTETILSGDKVVVHALKGEYVKILESNYGDEYIVETSRGMLNVKWWFIE